MNNCKYCGQLTTNESFCSRPCQYAFGHTEESRAKLRKPKHYRTGVSPLRGRSLSPEVCQRISQAKQGHTVSEETRRRISKTKMGCHINFRNPELRSRRISQRLKGNKNCLGRQVPQELRDKMARAKLGHEVTEETRAKISASKKGVSVHSQETRQRMSAIRKGKPCHSEASRRRLSQVNKGNKHCLGRKWTDASRAKLSATRLRQHDRFSLISKGLWRRQGYAAKVLGGASSRPNQPERRFLALLDSLFPGDWRYIGDGSLVIGGACPDFTNVNGRKALIEMFGDYWHRGCQSVPERIREGRNRGNNSRATMSGRSNECDSEHKGRSGKRYSQKGTSQSSESTYGA